MRRKRSSKPICESCSKATSGRVIGGIRQMVTKGELSKHKCEKAEQCLNYFAERCEYMKYDEYLAAGYPIGSGVVEGACRHLVKDRMEQTGMRWRIAGAQAVLSLRAIYVNDDWDTFHADRIQLAHVQCYAGGFCGSARENPRFSRAFLGSQPVQTAEA